MGFVRVLDRRHQPVDDADQQYAAEKGQGRNTHPGLGSVDGSDSLPCLLEQFDERNVDHHAARQSQRERKQSLVGTVSEKGYCAADTGCQAGAKGEHQGYKKSVSHLEYCFSVGLCKDSASRKLCQIYLDATEAPPVFCKDRARGSRSVLSEAARGCLFAVKLVNFILSLPENIE